MNSKKITCAALVFIILLLCVVIGQEVELSLMQREIETVHSEVHRLDRNLRVVTENLR